MNDTDDHSSGGFNDSSELEPTCGPDWKEIEEAVSGACREWADDEELERLTPEEYELALKGIRTLMKWVFQGGKKNIDGITIRTILVCWISLPFLRNHHSLTEMANGFGKHKQSLGRWHDDFKLRFPTIKTEHMHIK